MSTHTQLGIPPGLLTRPLTEALRGDNRFHLVHETRPALARKLQHHELAAALLSPLDYAKESSEYVILPGIAAASRFGNGSIVVHFRKDVKNITTLAVDPAYAAEIVIARIILAEEFDLRPELVPMNAPVDIMLQNADAALLTGDEAFVHHTDDGIDIVEEWTQMTELPLIHAVWCCREGSLNATDIQHLEQAAAKGSAGIDEIAHQFPPPQRESVTDYLRSFSYMLDDEARQALAEMMKYFYYHGVLPDVAELNFYRSATTETDQQQKTVRH